MAQHNLQTVLAFEVSRTISKARFWLTALIVPVVMAVVVGLLLISNASAPGSGADGSGTTDAPLAFTYSDASGYVDTAVASTLGGKPSPDDRSEIDRVRAGTSEAHFVFPLDPARDAVKVYGTDKGLVKNSEYGAVATQVLIGSAKGKIGDPMLAALAEGNVTVDSTTFADGSATPGIGGFIPPLAFVLIFFLVIMLLSNQMLNSTLEEKENRVTEMILTTVNPTVLISGKVISLFVIGLIQMAIFVLPVVIGYLLLGDRLNLPAFDVSSLVFNPPQILIGSLLLIGGFALFTGTLVAIGAVMPSAKEAGNFFAILIGLVLVPVYALTLIISQPTSLIVQFLSYFPYSAPITAMLRNSFGSLGGLEATIIIVELFVLSYIMLRVAVRLFRYGSIAYTSKVSLRSVFAKPKVSTR